MNASVAKSSKHTFLLTLDDEALEILYRISVVAKERPIQIIRRLVLGGIALQCIIEKKNKSSGT